jgi:hypothetical protein
VVAETGGPVFWETEWVSVVSEDEVVIDATEGETDNTELLPSLGDEKYPIAATPMTKITSRATMDDDAARLGTSSTGSPGA